MRALRVVCAGALSVFAACDSPAVRAEGPESRQVVDSILPREESLRRFRVGLAPVDSLSGGAPSRDALLDAFVRALGEADTAGLARMAVSRSEFGYLYYPTASQGLPPYDLDPELMWFLLFERSNQGIRRALQRYGGGELRLVGHECRADAQREGANVIHGGCVIRWRSPAGDTTSGMLFSQILERGGRFKFLSYANQLQ